MQLDEPPGEGEPEPRAFGVCRMIAADLPELVEYDFEMIGGDSHAGVLDGDLDA